MVSVKIRFPRSNGNFGVYKHPKRIKQIRLLFPGCERKDASPNSSKFSQVSNFSVAGGPFSPLGSPKEDSTGTATPAEGAPCPSLPPPTSDVRSLRFPRLRGVAQTQTSVTPNIFFVYNKLKIILLKRSMQIYFKHMMCYLEMIKCRRMETWH